MRQEFISLWLSCCIHDPLSMLHTYTYSMQPSGWVNTLKLLIFSQELCVSIVLQTVNSDFKTVLYWCFLYCAGTKIDKISRRKTTAWMVMSHLMTPTPSIATACWLDCFSTSIHLLLAGLFIITITLRFFRRSVCYFPGPLFPLSTVSSSRPHKSFFRFFLSITNWKEREDQQLWQPQPPGTTERKSERWSMAWRKSEQKNKGLGDEIKG